MLLLFLLWAGKDAFGSIELPDPRVFLYGIGVVVLIGLVAMAIPPVRHVVVTKLLPIVAKAGGGLRDVLSRPGKLALLVGGSAMVSLSYITAVYFAAQAFGCDLSYAQIGAIYLAGSAVATAAPTPGGLGALEAALIAGFVAAGVSRNIAVPTVFFYRLATFWLPILPGAFSFSWLRRHDYL
jgi:undecaprenyl-diphosphatase